MNAALRMLMVPSTPAGPSDRCVRTKAAASPSNSSTITVTFNEATALDSTYLLVAVVAYTATSRVLTATGWTKLAGTHTSTDMDVFVKQGDSTTNSITVTTTVSTQRYLVSLMAFAGYSSLTPLNNNSLAQAAQTLVTVTPTSTPSGYGVAIAAAVVPTNFQFNWTGTGGQAWTNSFLPNEPAPFIPSGSSAGTMWTARREYTAAAGDTYATVSDWSSSSTVTWQSVIMPLTP